MCRLLLCCCLLLTCAAPARARDFLRACWQQQGQPLGNAYLVLRYQEEVNELDHNQAPWQPTVYAGRGTVWLRAEDFRKQDTLTQVARQRAYYSLTQRDATTLLYRDYGDQDLLPMTPTQHQDYLLRAARYAPLGLLAYARQHRVLPAAGPTALVHYRFAVGSTQVELAIRRADALLDEVSLLAPDDLLGDLRTTFRYLDYARLGKLRYARRVQVEKANGHVREEVRIGHAATAATAPTLLTAPAGYQLRPAPEPTPTARAVTYRPHLHWLELPHTDDRVLVVEFKSFLVVAEAPLSSANGELIIREARRLAPDKPIRYFVAGHHHPHYLGGLRPFVAQGATVLVGAGSADYARYLATAPHTLRPDSLQRHPRPAQVEEIALNARKVIAEDGFEMHIHCIGGQSAHTADYLLYYFPSEKLLFEDDLAAVPQQGPARKAGARQQGLYQAIKALQLPVDTIVQSWPVAESRIKTIFSFAELEQSVK